MSDSVAYRSTLSDATVAWRSGIAPDPVPPKEPGTWTLIGAPTSITMSGHTYLVWTWIELDSAIKQGVQVGTALAESEAAPEPTYRSVLCTCDEKRDIEEFGHHPSCRLGKP